MKSKSTKRALLSSLFTLLLCFTMLLGTTFAWFTDTASTNVNTIKSGDLEIVLEYLDGTEWKNAEGGTLNFKAADNRAEILWEPGATYELPKIRVRNNGNLALNYKLEITGVKGDAGLLEVIDFTANGKEIFEFEGVLNTKDGASEEILIKGHMQETASSKYENLEISGISITVTAYQQPYEKDSIDDQYDANAKKTVADGLIKEEDGTLIATSMKGLSSAAGLASTDPSITSVTYETNEGSIDVPVVSNTNDLTTAIKDGKEVILVKDGSYDVPSVDIGKEIDIVGTKNATLNINSVNTKAGGSTLNITGITIQGQTSGDFAGMGNGTKANYVDCKFIGKTTLYGTTTYTDCTFETTDDYAVWTWGAGTVTFDNCIFNSGGKALLVYANVLDNQTNHQTVKITDCTFNDNGTVAGKAAIETGNDYGKTYDLIITRTTVNGFEQTSEKPNAQNVTLGGDNLGTNVWGNKNLMTGDSLNVVIDGTEVY